MSRARASQLGRRRASVGAQRAALELEAELDAVGTAARAASEKRYLKSELHHLGTGVPALRKVTRAWLGSHPELGRPELLAVVKALWGAPVHERRMAAVELLCHRPSLLAATDLALVERLVRESRTWALVDPLAVHVAGGLIERFPDLVRELDAWSRDDDFWVRRSALLSLLRPLRRGEGDFARFGRYADAMLEEREFFVRKAIGWVLRDTGRKRPDLVYRWLRPRATRASGVTLREALKILNEAQRTGLLAARERPPRRRSA